ncbi:hypothetical protein SNE40_018793 [Patella caerulea]|uniref:G-protein coupled receptors family 1 profile domain-containing protein n=1 Tax=Patella caerulea TaxID=87958 RepID=A0AAN8P8K0_PATCE
MTSYASVLTITAFTAERYVAICRPLLSQSLSSLSRAVKIIIGIWIVACICALPYPIHTRVFYEIRNPYTNESIEESLLCNIPSEWRIPMGYMFQFSTFAFFIIPMIVITIVYILIGAELWNSKLGIDNTKNKQAAAQAAKARKAVLKMLVAVVIAFFVCWAPFHVQRLMTIYVPPGNWTVQLLEIQTYIFYVSGVLYFVSSTVNPILYNVLSKRYRRAFKMTLCRCCHRNKYTNDLSLCRSSPSVGTGTSVAIYTNQKLFVKHKPIKNGLFRNSKL